MGVYGFHLLASDHAWETLRAVKVEFGLAGMPPCEADSPDGVVMRERGEEMTKWVTSARFTAKAFASKPTRLVVLAAAFMESGVPLPAALKDKALAESGYLAYSHPDRNTMDIYRLEEFRRLCAAYDGRAVEFSSSMEELLNRGRGDAAVPWTRWTQDPGGAVSFRSAADRLRASHGLDLTRSSAPDGVSDADALASARSLLAERPAFNLSLPADFDLWADLSACETDVRNGHPAGETLAGVAARLREVARLASMGRPLDPPSRPQGP